MRIPLAISLLFIAAVSSDGQVVAPSEISDPAIRTLQQDSLPQLQLVAKNIATHKFDYDFYLTRKLDIDEKQQKSTDQHSIRFENYQGGVVLAISGNYFGAYPAAKFTPEQRARRTFFSVVLPLAKASVPILEADSAVQGYAFEISHHVISKAMGLPVEIPENLMIYIPRAAAIKLINAHDRSSQQAALLDSQVFLNAQPLNLWLSDEGAPSRNEIENSHPVTLQKTSLQSAVANPVTPPAIPAPSLVATAAPLPIPAPEVVAVPTAPAQPPAHEFVSLPAAEIPRDISPQALASLQSANQAVNNHLVKDLAAQAHFITYAPPAFVPFRNRSYLELSMSTTISESSGASRYKLAALTFDEQISPLIRRVLTYYPNHQDFDGVSFSTTVHTPIRQGVPHAAPLSIEFFFPLTAMRSYEAYDITGQELLNGGVILIDGERVGLDLQQAEAAGRQ